MKRRNLCSGGVALLLLIPAIGHAQSAEQLGHCTELINRSSQLLDGEQTISMMADYRKGTLTFGSEDLKNELLRKMEALAREKSTHDLDALRKEQLKDIPRNERQYLADCSDVDTNKRYRASTCTRSAGC
jgi:hypothetical protein